MKLIFGTPVVCSLERLTFLPHYLRVALIVLVLGFTLSSAHAATGLPWIDSNTNLTFYGDLRLRYELDWDARDAAGNSLDNDRNRGRVRARGGVGYKFSENWSAGVRVRTGSHRSQQSPHLTFASDPGDPDDLNFVFDRYYIQGTYEGLSGWVGRNSTPFWYQNELFWDEDVTPTGLAGTYEHSLGEGTLTGVAGAFMLPDGGYQLNGQMFAGQARYSFPVSTSRITVAGGMHYMVGKSGASYLLDRNGDRDYLVSVASAQWSVPIREIPLVVGADLFYNFEDYDAADVAPFPAADTDEVLGYVLSVQLGQLKQRHDWLVGYYYAYVETFAANASYAQDDWVRFGNGPQTAGTDIEGHEARVGYALSANINVLGRLYLVDSITTDRASNRFRIDLNWRF